MQIRPMALAGAACLLLLSVPIPSYARQPDWLKKLAARLPQFRVRASPISRLGTLSPDGKWLATDCTIDPGGEEGFVVGTERYGIEILDRTGKVVQEVTRGNPRFLSVSGGVWGKDSKTLYFGYGSRLHSGNRNIVDGPEIWAADLGSHKDLPHCTTTSFTQLPIWSPRGDSYLIDEIDRTNVKSSGDGQRLNVVLIDTKRKTGIRFRDATSPTWSPNGRWILLVNEPSSDKGRNPYLRIADTRSGKERTFAAATSSAAENRRYGWVAADFNGACWLADSNHLLMGVTATRNDGIQIKASFVVSSHDGSRTLIPGIYPLPGSRNGRTILIERPDKKLFLLDISPKRAKHR